MVLFKNKEEVSHCQKNVAWRWKAVELRGFAGGLFGVLWERYFKRKISLLYEGNTRMGREIMTEEERVMVRVVYATKELDVLKRLARIVEVEKVKVEKCLEAQIIQIEAAKNDLVGFVVNGSLDLQKTMEIQEIIRHLNTILDVEANKKACMGVN